MKVYVVVDVMSGVVVEVKCFRHVEQARACKTRLRKGRNLDEDDVQLFESTIHVSSHQGSILAASSQKSRKFAKGTKR